MYKVFILGPQGCGKGTQAERLSNYLHIPQFSMGHLLREAGKGDGPLSHRIAGITSSGNLVPDDVAMEVLTARLEADDAQNGYVLDGFPRNKNEYQAFADYDTPTHVIVITVPREVSLERLTSRAKIENRVDDTPEVIDRRLEIYETETRPMINYYRELGVVHEVDGVGTIDEVAGRIQAIF